MRNARIFKSLRLLFLFFLIPALAFSQNISINGVVKDASGDGLPGVAISEIGTSNGTLTDIDGKFTLTVSSKGKIKVSMIGFQAQEINVSGKTSFNIVLEEDTKLLDEVVVVGYGQMKRTDLTGSVVSVSSDAISKSVTTSVDQVLQGRAAGVQVTQNSGMPGGGSSIRIRGTNSINSSNEPIFVIDGVVIDGNTDSGSENALSSINPADILSMDILKDASATAIYGSRGANGVIIITTKRGESGTPRITYDGYVGMQTMPKKLDLLNLQEFAYHKNERTRIMGHPMDDSFIRPDLLGEGTDWQDELFRTAVMHNHNLSVSGGTSKMTYAFGAGYLNQEGIALGSGFERFSLRGNIDAEVKSWLKMGVNFAVNNSKQNITVSDDNLINIALQQTPNVAARNPDGSYGGPDTDEFVQTNPVGLAMLKDNRNEKSGFRSNIYAEATIIDGLTLKTEFSSDINNTNVYKFTPSYEFGAIKNEVRESERSKSYSKFWAWRNIATYNKTVAEKHAINVMLGQEMQESKWDYLWGYRKGFITNNANDLDAGDATTAKANNSSGINSLMSYFGRAFYSFDDRYLLTATLRRDGSSRFADGNRWGWFPSAALAWKISNESFLKESKTINNMKFRLGWGKVGNENIQNYGYTSTMSSVATIWGTGLLSGNTANPDLQWETTSSVNVGFDLNLFRNRIELIVEWYNKETDNLLLLMPLPAYVGTSGQGSTTPPWVNIGSIRNRGFEVTLNTFNIDKKDFSWKSNFVFSSNRNKVLSLDMESSIVDATMSRGSETSIITRTAVGQPIGQFYGYKVIGRFESATDFYYKDANGNIQQTAIPEGVPISKTGVWVGDLMFEDKDGDGKITEADRDYIGNPEPKFTFGIGNTFTYKDFDLTVYLNGSYGGDVFNWIRRWTDDPRQSTNVTKRATTFARLGVIDPTLSDDDFRNVRIIGGASNMPRLAPSDANANNRVSDRYIEDGSYLRIQNISLGYTLPKKMVNKLHIENLRVYTNIQNLHTFSKYKGYDPELGSMSQNALLTGIDNARYPSPVIYTFGLNVTF